MVASIWARMRSTGSPAERGLVGASLGGAADEGEGEGDQRDLVLLDEPCLDALGAEDALDVVRLRRRGDDDDEGGKDGGEGSVHRRVPHERVSAAPPTR